MRTGTILWKYQGNKSYWVSVERRFYIYPLYLNDRAQPSRYKISDHLTGDTSYRNTITLAKAWAEQQLTGSES